MSNATSRKKPRLAMKKVCLFFTGNYKQAHMLVLFFFLIFWKENRIKILLFLFLKLSLFCCILRLACIPV